MGVPRSVLAAALATTLSACGGSEAPAASQGVAPPSSTPSASAADVVTIPGTHAVLLMPPGFSLSQRFRGLAGDAGWVTVNELQAPIEEFRQSWSDDATLKEQVGITVGRRTDLLSLEGQGFLIEGTSDVAAGTGTVTMAYVGSFQGDETTSLLVQAYIAEASLDALPAVTDTVRRAGFDRGLVVDPWAGLTFRVEPAAPLLLATSQNDGVYLDTSGQFPPVEPLEPAMAIEPARRGAMSPADATTARLDGNDRWTVASIESQDPIQVAGVDGLETIALGVQEGQDIVIYVAILQRIPADLELIGRCLRSDRDRCLPAFMATTRSFVPTR